MNKQPFYPDCTDGTAVSFSISEQIHQKLPDAQ